MQVIAFAMKENGWSVYKALEHVKKCRSCVQPNPGFMSQLFVYEGILKARYEDHEMAGLSDMEIRILTL